MKRKKKGKKEVEEVDEEQEGTTGEKDKKKGKKKGKKKILLLIPVVLAVAAGAVFFLRGRGGEEKVKDDTIDAPQVYTLGEMELLALPVNSEAVVVHQPEVPEPAEGEEPITATTYLYEGFVDARGLLFGYASLLTTEDMGFVYVDETLTIAETPSAEEESGSMLLAKSGTEEGTVLTLQLSWTPENGTVVTDTQEGRIREPAAQTLSLVEAEDFLRSMDPASLGLTGDIMASYRIYPLAGSVLVDGRPCIHMSVYSVDETAGTNQIAGEYFIASDRSHIYRRDSISGRVSEVG